MDQQGGIVFQHTEDGPNGWMIMATGWLFSAGLVIVALAVFALANWVGMAVASLVPFVGGGTLMLCGSVLILQTCRGAAMLIEARGRAKALEKEAEGHYVASVRAARLTAPPSSWRVIQGEKDGSRN